MCGTFPSRDPHPPERLDVLGSACAVLGLGGLTYGLIEMNLVAGVVGGLVLCLFVVVERRSPSAVVPPSLFRSRMFVAANLVTLAVYAALGGVFFLLVLQLQLVAGYSPVAAGSLRCRSRWRCCSFRRVPVDTRRFTDRGCR